MTKRCIAVGIDVDDESPQALEQAAVLAKTSGATLLLLYINPELPESEVLHDQLLPVQRAQLTSAKDRLGKIAEQLTDVDVETRVVEGDAKRKLSEAAFELGATLLVVGTHGRTGVARFLLGSVAERNVRSSDIDVLVVRREPGPIKRVLVPTDFSKDSVHAIDVARHFVGGEAAVDILHCWEIPVPVSSPEIIGSRMVEPMRSKAKADALERGAKLVETYRDQFASVEFIARNIPPTYGIQDQLEEVEYDLVVMGSHGRTGISRWVIGSVAEVTVRHSPCSVLVVKHKH